jgi:hypothetical protein
MELATVSTPLNARLRGRWLILARGLWAMLALALLANFITGIPTYYQTLRTVCTAPDPQEDCQFWQPTPANVAALHRLGLSVNTYAVYFITVDVAVSLVFWIVGAMIFWRKSDEWMGLFVSGVLIMFGSSGISDTIQGAWGNTPSISVLGVLAQLPGLLQWCSLGLFLVTFPNGRFAPRWTWIVALLWVIQFFLFDVGGALGLGGDAQGIALLGVISLTYGSTAVVLIYRYLRVFTPVQRQQTKWVVFGVATGVLIQVLSGIIQIVIPEVNAPDAPFQLLGGLFTALLFLPIPLSVGIAILRYRLWDIDTIINKALVYGVLTALLGAIYAGLIIGLISLAGVINSAATDEPIALVIATLAIAALFRPVRSRIQRVIDRRFYRKKYDAAKTLAAFSATLRSEVDLSQLSEHLVAVVQETMQPAHLTLWLRQPERQPTSPAHTLEQQSQ